MLFGVGWVGWHHSRAHDFFWRAVLCCGWSTPVTSSRFPDVRLTSPMRRWICRPGRGRAAARQRRAAKADPHIAQPSRYRKARIKGRQREAGRLHKLIEDTGIKLDCVASDILGKSGRAMLEATIAGTTGPRLDERGALDSTSGSCCFATARPSWWPWPPAWRLMAIVVIAITVL